MVEGPEYAFRLEAEAAIARWLVHARAPADQAVAHFWRGRSRGLVHPQDGVAEYRAALALSPDLSEARLHLAGALLETDLAEAARHLELLRSEPGADGAVWLMLAQARRGLGQTDAARACLDQLLSTAPGHAAALLARGQLELEANRPADAVAQLERARQAAPADPAVHLALSQAHHLAGRDAESARFQESYRTLESLRLAREQQQREQSRDAWRARVAEGRLP